MSDSTILVLGATGSTGRRVTERLRAAGAEVRAASRSGEVRFDWTDQATWEPALAGAERMYLMAPHELPIDPALVALAVAAGVRHIVLLSSRGIEAMGDERLLAAERTVRGSGADWTIVRPDWFDQNFDEGFFHPAIMAGELAVPFGDVKQGFVDADDIAAVAATALTTDGHAGRTYELTGPAPLSFGEAVAIIGRVSGREVVYKGSDEDYLAAQTAFGAPEEQTRAEVAAFTAAREQGDTVPTGTVERVTGNPPKPFERYAEEAAGRGAWKR